MAKSRTKLSERRFNRFMSTCQEINGKDFYDPEEIQKVKDVRKDSDEITDSVEEILTALEGIYRGKAQKKELKEFEEYMVTIIERRSQTVTLFKDTIVSMEVKRNKENIKRDTDSGRGTERREGGEEGRQGKDTQFKEPVGGCPDMITREYSPPMGKRLGGDHAAMHQKMPEQKTSSHVLSKGLSSRGLLNLPCGCRFSGG